MIHRRQFTAAFKAQVVLELLSGAKSRVELCREHRIASSVLANMAKTFWLIVIFDTLLKIIDAARRHATCGCKDTW
jgi:hypothetical protein